MTVSDADSGFHIHGISGLLQILLTFGLLGDSGHETANVVSVAVAPYSRTNTAPTAPRSSAPTICSPEWSRER